MTSCTPDRPRVFKRAQERGPERTVLAIADVEAKHLPVPVRRHAGRDHHGLRDDPVVHPGLAVGGVQEHIPERLPGQ
jgi:hypothetical protein